MSAFVKDILREIKKTMGRFISLFVITALGASSIVGIQATSIDMRAAADKMYKSRMLYDLHIKSTMGFDGDDADALREADGVRTVMPTYMHDVFIDFGTEMDTARAFALPDTLNMIDVLDGRLPENAGECVIERGILRAGDLRIGDTLTLMLDNMDDYYEFFKENKYTIVGVVSSPLYISHERGNTSLGDGSLHYFLYLHPDAFTLDVYTDIFIVMQDSHDMDNLTDDYYIVADVWRKEIEKTGGARVEFWENELTDAQREIDEGWDEYHDGVRELEEKLAEAWRELNDAEIEMEDAKIKLTDGQKELDEKIADGQRTINANLRELRNGQAELDSQKTQVQAAEAMGMPMDEAWEEINIAQARIDAGLTALEQARRTLETERARAQAEIDDGWEKFYEGLNEYNEGIETLLREEKDARAELEDGKVKLLDAQEKRADAPTPEWFYFTRKDGIAYDSYYQDTLRLQKIGYIFPLVFFLVAIMVSLTTQARMVEEQRTQIGIYKALGYRPFAIMQKYLVYSLTASLSGGIAGVFAGSIIFPLIISDAYGHLYRMPPIETPVPPVIGVLAVMLSTLSIVAVTLITCMGSMLGVPAELMRPKPPPIGKRVLLERVHFIWNRLSFIGKVTARNIFRYKKRFLMTLVGIAGCSALLVTAFGLRDGVGGVADMQFDKIIKYDLRAYTKMLTNGEQRRELEKLLPGTHMFIRDESVDAKGVLSGEGLPATITVAETPEELNNYIKLTMRKSGESVPMTDNSVIVTEKLARVMDVDIGGSFTMIDTDGRAYTAEVTGIVENYVLHYIYMSPSIYSEIFNKEYYPNGVLALTNDTGALAASLLGNDNVRAVIQTDEQRKFLSDEVDAMDVVTVVLIVLACALAFVVLFNLTNINITERIRELATIKVLGFYNGEMSMYIFRENAAVTFMGIALGLFGGVFLHRFVLQSAEIDLLMFPTIIRSASYIYAVALSVVFSVFVNLVMNIKLAGIDMVESLKNVE